MPKRNISLYFAENIQQPFNPKEYINKKDKDDITFTENENIFYCTKYYTHSISWADFFEKITNSELPTETFRKYYAIVFFVTSKNNMFAITFGTGNNKLNKSKFVYNFGLKTTLNMLNSEGYIYKQSSKSISEAKTKKDIGSSSALQISQLDFNQLTDLLNAVNGDLEPEYQNIFGCKKVQGGQSLNISIDTEHLSEQLETIETAFQSSTYKDKFKFIDNISPILRSETELKNTLESKMLSAVQNRKFALFAPLGTTEYYAIDSISYDDKNIESLDTSEFLQMIPSQINISQNISDSTNNSKMFVNFIKNKEITIHLKSFTGEDFVIKKKLYDFISMDLELEGSKFLLEQGIWFRFSPDLTNTVDDFFNARVIKSPIEFHRLPKSANNTLQREEDYLKEISKNYKSFILGDQKLVDQTEVFDLFSNNTLYHIKKGISGSAPLSHLFAQGLVSIERLKGEQAFFKKTSEQFPKAKIDMQNLYIKFGIIKNTSDIPIFSKITFKSNAEAIEKRIMNKVNIFFIPYEE